MTGLISPNRLARVASLAYLVVIVAGGWSELVVRGPLAVEGDAAATAANIVESNSLLRWAFAADMAMIVAFLAVGLTLWALLRGVSREAAIAMLVANAISVAVMSANLLNHGAIVVLEEGAEATPEELIEHARQHIAGYKVPKSVEIRTEPLPLSGAMKVLKRELRDPYWAGRERGI